VLKKVPSSKDDTKDSANKKVENAKVSTPTSKK